MSKLAVAEKALLVAERLYLLADKVIGENKELLEKLENTTANYKACQQYLQEIRNVLDEQFKAPELLAGVVYDLKVDLENYKKDHQELARLDALAVRNGDDFEERLKQLLAYERAIGDELCLEPNTLENAIDSIRALRSEAHPPL